jgi:hypothetical protein
MRRKSKCGARMKARLSIRLTACAEAHKSVSWVHQFFSRREAKGKRVERGTAKC